jgi:UDPglucose 6-dehydrogenase
MQVVVFGLWHLGCVTAACLARAGHQVVGLDRDGKLVQELRQGRPPLHEPGLPDLLAACLAAGRLTFTSDAAEALRGADVLWVTFDTPVNDRDEADVGFVRAELEAVRDAIPPGTLVLLSSQMPAGFTRALETDWQGRGLRFAYSPENLRLGKAIEVFENPERVVVGLRHGDDRPRLAALFPASCPRLEWMSVESAEMTKHALNAFLATSVTFINELARLCEVVGADAREVERGLKSEARIGPRAYLSPGAAFAGGTLARDVCFLIDCGRRHQLATPLLSGVLAGNERHKGWVHDQIRRYLGAAPGAVVAVLGLTYKPGTSTLRRSSAVELCQQLHAHGARVRFHDPMVPGVPEELAGVGTSCGSVEEVLDGADAVVLATPWPQYRELRGDQFAGRMRRPLVIDQAHFLADVLASDPRITYVATGRGGRLTQGLGRAA